ncbi:MAG: hypothetical protein RR056_04310 [Acetivibrio sp.]
MSRTKIIILSIKEIIYTSIFIGLGLLLILLLIIMFRPISKDKEKTPAAQNEILYHPGVYTTQITLGQNSLNLEIMVDADHINSVRFVNLEETVSTMYPLIEPSLEAISTQLVSGLSLENVILPAENQYTQELLMDAIHQTLSKAYISSN